jgi:hypothetical protein
VLGLEGEVTVDVLLQPPSIAFGEVPRGTPTSRELSLQVQEPERVKIVSVSIDDPHFELVRKSGDAASSAGYEVRLKKADKLGRLSAKIHVELTGAEPSTIDVPVNGEVVGDLRYQKRLSFRRSGADFPPRDLTISSRSNKPVQVLGAEDQGKVLKAEVTQAKGDKAVVRLTVSKTEAEGKAAAEGKLVIRTTDRDEPKIEIEYTVVYRSDPRVDRLIGPPRGPVPLPPPTAVP